jgi:hypothetical protein
LGRRIEGRSCVFGATGCTILLGFVGVALALGVVSSSASSAPWFASATRYATGRLPASVAIGDLNGDGKQDLATANVQANTVSVLLNRGNGRFRARRDYRTGRSPISVATGDLNGDRKPDLAIVNRNEVSTVSVLESRGDGSFAAPLDYPTGRAPTSVAIGDLNGDGKRDLAIAKDSANTVSVFLNSGDGTFGLPLDYPVGRLPSSVAIGDLNGDGKRDLATANYNAKSVSVLLNKGDGSFARRRNYRTGRFPNSIALGDLNGDRKLDVATANSNGDFPLVPNSVSVLLNRSGGSVAGRRDYRTADDPRWVGIGDLSGDGKPDLATAGYSVSNVSLLVNRGDGSFQPRLEYRAGLNDGIARNWSSSLAIGDLNGDRKRDLAITNPNANRVAVLLATMAGVCIVPNVEGKTLPAVRRAVARAQCRVGKIGRATSRLVEKGRVISEDPTPRTVLRQRGKVNLVVSRGRKR